MSISHLLERSILKSLWDSRILVSLTSRSINVKVKADAYVLNLPYGNYTGVLDETNDVVVFENVRYAGPPLGDYRWQKPQLPNITDPIQGGKCFQACPEWACGSVSAWSYSANCKGSDERRPEDVEFPETQTRANTCRINSPALGKVFEITLSRRTVYSLTFMSHRRLSAIHLFHLYLS